MGRHLGTSAQAAQQQYGVVAEQAEPPGARSESELEADATFEAGAFELPVG